MHRLAIMTLQLPRLRLSTSTVWLVLESSPGDAAGAIHVGGLEGPGLEDEKTPRVALRPFGTVLARSACAARSR